MLRKTLAVLILALFSSLLAGCGVIGETDFPGCAPTGSSKTYRGIGCTRICKAAYSNCSNGKNADPDNDCKCTQTPPNWGNGLGQVPDPIPSSCACYYGDNPPQINLHLVSCPPWLDNIKPGEIKTGIGRPIGSGNDSSCTNICSSGGGKEIRGVFQFKTGGKGACTQNAVIFPGTISGEYVSGGQLATVKHEQTHFSSYASDAVLRAEARIERVDLKLASRGLLHFKPVNYDQNSNGAAEPTQFKMQDLKVDCSAECAKAGENCAEFEIDSDNSKSIKKALSKLPVGNTAQVLDLADLRSTFDRATTACSHKSIVINERGNVRSDGTRCQQPLYMSFSGIKDFSSSILVPSVVNATLSISGNQRKFVFQNEEGMIALQLQPQTLQRSYGGKIRYAAIDNDRLVFETQNYCVAIKLQK